MTLTIVSRGNGGAGFSGSYAGTGIFDALQLDVANHDVNLARLAAASLRLGAAPSATPVANTLTIGESSRSGTDTNIAGASGTLQPGAGTGIGATTPLILKAPIQVASGSGAQTQTEGIRVQAVATAIGLGFLGHAAVIAQTVGANVNNVVASGTTGQFDDFTNGTVYATDYAALHATIYQLTRTVTQISTALRSYGLGV